MFVMYFLGRCEESLRFGVSKAIDTRGGEEESGAMGPGWVHTAAE